MMLQHLVSNLTVDTVDDIPRKVNILNLPWLQILSEFGVIFGILKAPTR